MTCRDCGNPIEVCSDPHRPFYPLRVVCFATMEREAAHAAYSALHADEPYHDGSFTSWSKARSTSHPYHFDSGVIVGVSADPTPDDPFTTERDAQPPELVAQQAPGEQDEAHGTADDGDSAGDLSD